MAWIFCFVLLQDDPRSRDPREWTPLQMPAPEFGLGPLTLGSRSPFQMLRQGFTPRAPYPLGQGQIMVTQTITWTNLWSYETGTYWIDGEILREGTYLTWGMSDVLQIGFEVGAFHRSGGFADSFIEAFHSAIGVGQAQRGMEPRNQFAVRLRHPDGSVTEADDTRKISLEDTQVFAQGMLATEREAWVTLAVGAQLKIPTGTAHDLFDGREAGGVYVTIAKTVAPDMVVYAAAGGGFYPPEHFGGVDLVQMQWTAMLTIEYRVADGFSILLQNLAVSGAAKDYEEFSEPSYEITLGFKARLTRTTMLEFGVLENLIYYENSPDFGIHLGLTLVR